MAVDASGNYILADDSVANRVAKITSGGSDLMKMARTQGMQTANRRGLGNSSIAVGAAEMSALNAAVPIASQEASQVAQRNVTGMGLAAEDARLTRTIAADMERTKLGLESEAERQRVGIAADDARLTRTIGAEDNRLGVSTAADMARLKETISAEEARTRMQIAADQQKSMLAGVTDLTGNRFTAISNTLQNDKIPAASRAAVQSSIDGQYNQALDYIQNIYGASISNPVQQQVAPIQQVPAAGYNLTPAQAAALQAARFGGLFRA